MADVTVDNGGLTDFVVDTVQLTDGSNVQNTQLVTAVEAGASTGLAKAEDAAHSSGDYGIMALAVRTDTAAARATTDGDYIPLIVDSSGRLHVNAGSVPAAARTSDSVSAALAVDRLMKDLTALTPTKLPIGASSSGNNTLLAAQGSGNKILVHQMFLIAASAVTVRVESAGSGDLTGDLTIDAKQGFVLPFSPIGWFETVANEALTVNLSGAVSVAGAFAYTVTT